MAQKEDPINSDFCQLVQKDRQLIDCQLGDNRIEAMLKYDLKTLGKKKAKQAAFSRLLAIRETQTKMGHISYDNSFNCQPYMHTLTRAQSSLLLALTTLTVRGIRSNYGDTFPDKQCPLPGCSEPDSLPHTLACQVLVGTDRDLSLVQYGDVFSNTAAAAAAVARFKELLLTRARILES